MDVYTVKVLKPLVGKYGHLHRKGLKTLWKESMDIYTVKVLKPSGGKVWTSTP